METAEQFSPKSTDNFETRCSTIGDDIELVGESRADFEMRNEEDEEPLEAEIPRVRMNPENPTSRESKNMKVQDMLVHRSWCAACVQCRGLWWASSN